MDVVERFRSARRDPTLAVLEGFHCLKHALRFGATIREVVASDDAPVGDLVPSLAPDLRPALEKAERLPAALFDLLSPTPVPTRIVALADRPRAALEVALADLSPAPLVFLERPRRLENVGAVIRVSAAAGAAGVLVSGVVDPWHPAALRGSAGLHFALPVEGVEDLDPRGRTLVAVDPSGPALGPGAIPDRAIVAFGTEREGLSEALLGRADLVLGIRMRPGVSSLNLATAAAVALYLGREGAG